MKNQLVFATNNENKLKEARSLLKGKFEILSLTDIGCNEDLPETKKTLEGNALQKAKYVFDKYKVSCFADDTGLEVQALYGAPGVRSARYSGKNATDEKNMDKLLKEMNEEDHRDARFRTVIAYVTLEGEQTFEGIVEGEITREKNGEQGFGYDPIFRPFGNVMTFAEMSMKDKNAISHRGRALRAFVEAV